MLRQRKMLSRNEDDHFAFAAPSLSGGQWPPELPLVGGAAWSGGGTPYLYLVGGSTTLSNILGLKNIYNDGKKMYSKYLAKDLKT